MVELAGISPFGGGGVNIRPNTEPASQAVPAVEAAVAGQGLSGRMSSGHSQSESGAGRHSEQQAAIAYKKKADKHAVPGPPPTFQISLLEMDRDLSETLARINAAHAMPRDSAAIAAPEAPAADAAGAGVASPAGESTASPSAGSTPASGPKGADEPWGYSAA